MRTHLMPAWTPDMPLVVCLCAQWCNVCEQYRNIFRQVQSNVQSDYPQARFVLLVSLHSSVHRPSDLRDDLRDLAYV